MPPVPDPFQAHLDRATSLFEAGDVVQAWQIWQAILKRDPASQAARAGLFRVKQFFDQREGAEDSERLLHEGCTLFDMGQVADALQKWERILEADPNHHLAFAYANDARRQLGLAPLEAPGGAPAQAREAPRADAGQLVREGVQIYDMGMVEEAVAKWRRALELDPQHQDAQAYLEMARRELEQAAKPPISPATGRAAPAAAPAAPPQPAPAGNETRIWRAQQLLRDWRLDEAVQAFQQLLDQGSPDPRILEGYHQARALQTARDEPPEKLPPAPEPAPAPPAVIPPPVGPPKALVTRTAQRDGFSLPAAVRRLRLPRWFEAPRNFMMTAGVLVLAITALVVAGVRRREAALREAVAAAKQKALSPVSRLVQIPSLAEPLAAVRAEAEGALADDPLLAYFRAQEWQRRDPDDPAAAQLVQKAKDKLTFIPLAATVADFDKSLQTGDLEGARKTILALLRHDPDDLDLRGRCRKVLLALAPLYAGEDRMAKARESLTLGRALFPQDPGWQARLKLLETLQGMAKSDRTPWIQLLG